MSFRVDEVKGSGAFVEIRSLLPKDNPLFLHRIDLKAGDADGRNFVNIFTGYEGYEYERSCFEIKTKNCRISRILFEKMRPAKKPSIFGQDRYIDDVSIPELGELVVKKVNHW